MPAAKGIKRAAAAQAPTESKKPKADPNLAAVLEAIGHADTLPEECRALLAAVAPSCFGTPADERHEHQATLVSWFADALDGVRAKLQAATEEADAEAAVAEQTGQGLSGHVAKAEAALAAAKQDTVTKESVLAAAVRDVAAAKTVLSAAQDAKERAAAGAEEKERERLALEAVLAEDLRILRQAEGFDAAEAQRRTRALVPLAERLGLEASLVLALPPACTKPPGERGAFDAAVLGRVEAGIAGRVRTLAAELEAAAASAKEYESGLEATRGNVSAAEELQHGAAAELEAAKARQRGAAEALGGAKAEIEAFVHGRALAEDARKAKAAALEQFTGHTLECFNQLRGRAATAGA